MALFEQKTRLNQPFSTQNAPKYAESASNYSNLKNYCNAGLLTPFSGLGRERKSKLRHYPWPHGPRGLRRNEARDCPNLLRRFHQNPFGSNGKGPGSDNIPAQVVIEVVA